MTPALAHADDLAEVYQGDATQDVELWAGAGGDLLVVDPPWDDAALLDVFAAARGRFESLLVFTDGRRMGETFERFGAPRWVFTWDTMNTWSVSTSAPVQQTKHCLLYGTSYDRDRELWGDAPPRRNHPTTKQEPLDGRRLTDLWSESLRWLHNPTAGRHAGGQGADRHKGKSQHAKPVGWVRCLIGNVTEPGDLVIDPCAGTGTTAAAASSIGRRSLSVEIEPHAVAGIVARLTGEPEETDTAQQTLFAG